jgi:hypothetical protein
MTEKELQNQIVCALRILGYTVLESGKGRSKTQCMNCKSWFYPKGWQGNTIGLPDLYVHNASWKVPFGVGIELKTEKGAVRKAQQELANESMTIICRSLDDVLAALMDAENILGTDTTKEKIKRFLNNEFRIR